MAQCILVAQAEGDSKRIAGAQSGHWQRRSDASLQAPLELGQLPARAGVFLAMLPINTRAWLHSNALRR